MALRASNVWPLERYARFIPENDTHVLQSMKDTAKKGGIWKHYSSSKDGACGIQLALVESNHFLISSGNQIYESFSLWEAHRWIKGVSKGDSILFIYQLKDENRRFRIKFSSQPHHKTPLETCNDCIVNLSNLIPIREMGAVSSSSGNTSQRSSKSNGSSSVTSSQVPREYEDSQMFSQEPNPIKSLTLEKSTLYMSNDPTLCAVNQSTTNDINDSGYKVGSSVQKLPVSSQTLSHKQADFRESVEVPVESELMPLPALAEAISSKGKSLGRAYAETNFPVSQLGEFIRLCLTDTNFPNFVETVEREMANITKY